jgi:hypothetical protein
MDVAFRRINGSETGLSGLEVAWTPMLEIFRHWLALRGTVGFFGQTSGGVFNNAFVGKDLKLELSLRLFHHLLLEFGPTWELWNGLGSVSGPTFTIGWEFTRHRLGVLDRIYFSFMPMGNPQFYEDRLQQQQSCMGMGPCGNFNNENIKELQWGVGLRF